MGRQDLREASRMKKALLSRFGSRVIDVEIDVVDEWVYVEIRVK